MRSGFTLLETLIALVIASLITLVLMDTLAAATGHARRIEQATRGYTARTLALIPVLRALNGAAPDYYDSEFVFTGDARTARGLTLASATGAGGELCPFEISIEDRDGQIVLVYREQDAALFETALPAGARLAYRDPAGTEHEVWPPEEGFNPDPLYYRPVPAAILILAGEAAVLAAAPSRTTGLTLRTRDFDLVL
tara:strand:+ start:1301 stop:1888 length:588 start_codon:yes stop_codon:yes gene_type:complete